jgi:hypothetical protein
MAYNNPDITKNFSNRRGALKAALDAALAKQEQQGAAQMAQNEQQFGGLRTQAYTNSRLSALGNNEALAVQGLAGNAYAAPQSGWSETSQSRQNVALGSILSNLGLQQQQQGNDINNQLAQNRMQGSANWLTQEANLGSEEMAAQQNDRQIAMQEAQNEVSMFGKVMTPKAAAVLGVPVGTRMRGSGGGGGGSSVKPQDISSLIDALALLMGGEGGGAGAPGKTGAGALAKSPSLDSAVASGIVPRQAANAYKKK